MSALKNDLRDMFVRRVGYEPNFDEPKSFNEKVNWRKLYDKDFVYPSMVDKYVSKALATNIIDKLEVNETLWIGKKVMEMPIVRPSIIKVTASSGRSWKIGKDFKYRGKPVLCKSISKALDTVYGAKKGEWAYSRVDNKIMVEKLMEEPFLDVKYFVFDGRVELIGIRGNDKKEKTWTGYDRDYVKVDVRYEERDNPDLDLGMGDEEKAEGLRIAERLSCGRDFMRIDLYYKLESRKFVFGEFTPYPTSGCLKWNPIEFDWTLGEKWRIRHESK